MNKSGFDELFSKYLADVVQQCENHDDGFWISTKDLKRFSFYQTIKNLPAKQKASFLKHLGEHICSIQSKIPANERNSICGKNPFPLAYTTIFLALMRTRLNLSPSNIVHFFKLYKRSHGFKKYGTDFAYWPINSTIFQLKKTLEAFDLTDREFEELSAITRWDHFCDHSTDYELPLRHLRAKLNLLLVLEIDGKKRVPMYSYLKGDEFGENIDNQLSQMPKDTQENWAVLFHHICQSAGARPTDNFLVEAHRYISSIGPAIFEQLLSKCLLSAADLPIIETPSKRHPKVNNRHFLTPANQDLLTGLIWSIPQPLDQEMKLVLAKVKENASHSVMYEGKIAPKVVKACNYALSLSA